MRKERAVGLCSNWEQLGRRHSLFKADEACGVGDLLLVLHPIYSFLQNWSCGESIVLPLTEVNEAGLRVMRMVQGELFGDMKWKRSWNKLHWLRKLCLMVIGYVHFAGVYQLPRGPQTSGKYAQPLFDGRPNNHPISQREGGHTGTLHVLSASR